MPTPNELALFLNLVFPWDQQHEQLYRCVSTIIPDRKNPENTRGICINLAVQTYDDLVRLIDSRRGWRQANLYVALGLQRMANVADTSNDGYPKAIRKASNMVSMNSLFVDIDVGKNGSYATAADAQLGLEQFLQASGMPEPTMIVRSGGGGMHVYWCTAEAMPIAVWQPLADGLKECAKQLNFKIDPTITADSARILRVPTTFNYKYAQPALVKMDAIDAIRQYTAEGLTSVLSKYMVVQAQKTGTGSGSSSTSAWGQNFTANAEQTLPKLSIDTIAVNCPMTAQTLIDGGAGKAEPDWSQDMFLAAWTDDPVATAHRLSSGHAQYSKADTDKKLAEKQAAIASGKLGWPKCASFNHAACQTCPLLSQGRSPIYFGHQAKAQTQPLQPKYVVDPLMPPEYWRNANDHVITNGEYGPVDVLGYPILDGGIDVTTQELVLKTSVSGRDRWGAVSLTKHTGPGVCESLYKAAKIIVKGGSVQQAIAKSFIMSWMTHLQTTKRQTTPKGLGWSGKNFVFGDEMYTPNGPESIYRGNTGDEKYQRAGELKPWQDATALIKGNPTMEIIVASAFAAPLVALACDYSLTLSVFSHQSGFGKSTAMKLAQAVWGNPRTGMAALDDTDNFMGNRSSKLKHLPLYWDELKTKDQFDKLVKIVFQNAQGRSKGRLNRNSTEMEIGTATTMLIVASNHGIASTVYRATDGTNAGGLRVFEVEAHPLVGGVPASVSEQLMIKLNENYGCPGAVYADFIVRNRAAVEQVVTQISDDLDPLFHFEANERFWKNTMVTLIAGASLANAAGLATFDIAGIRHYLYEALRDLRGSLSGQTYTMAGPDAGEGLMAEMQADLRGRNMIVTDYVPTPALGRATRTVTADFFDPQRTGDIWMQVGKLDHRILVRIRPFNDWLSKHNYHPDQALKILRRDYFIVPRRTSIGAGVEGLRGAQNRSDCWDMTMLRPPPPASHNPSSPSASSGSP
jgi:hypothetical protein